MSEAYLDHLLHVVAIKRKKCYVCGFEAFALYQEGSDMKLKPMCACGVEHDVEDSMVWN